MEIHNLYQKVIAYISPKNIIGSSYAELKLCIFDLLQGCSYIIFMIDSNDCKTIKVMQGETLTATITLDENEFKHVHSVTFICKDLDLLLGLIPDAAIVPDEDTSNSDSSGEPYDPGNENWYLLYTDTEELRPGVFTYDIDVLSEDGDAIVTTTLVYNAKLIIEPKNPKLYNAYYEYPHNTKREH